jgi:hypothetical protein
MVFILNGEMIPDSDPRALAAKGVKKSGGRSNTRRNNRFGSIHGASSSNSASTNSPSSNNNNRNQNYNQNNGPLNKLAEMMGIENQFLNTPAVANFLPPTKVPYIYLVVLAVLFFFFGIRALLVSVICWYIFHHHQTDQHNAV